MSRFWILFVALFAFSVNPSLAQDASENTAPVEEAGTPEIDGPTDVPSTDDASVERVNGATTAEAIDTIDAGPDPVEYKSAWSFTKKDLKSPGEWTLEITAYTPSENSVKSETTEEDSADKTCAENECRLCTGCSNETEASDKKPTTEVALTQAALESEGFSKLQEESPEFAAVLEALLESKQFHALLKGNSFVDNLDEGFQKFDQNFGKNVVAPVAEILFWDAFFWDNELITNVQTRVCSDCGDLNVQIVLSQDATIDAKLTHPTESEIVLAKVDSDNAKGSKNQSFSMPIGKSKEANLDKNFPIVVLWLVCGAIFLTFRMGFINLRGVKHAVKVTAGHYDDPNDPGEISHFQALSSALSATVGLGNIAGVAIAVAVGGPGAVFWMVMAGFLGMSSKFVECTLGQKFRKTREDGRVMGGAMYYLSDGLKEKGMGKLGMVLAVLFAVLCIGGSFGGGNAFQVNQSLNALEQSVPWFADYRWVYGLIMTALVGVVILGGLQRIASTAEKIVPVMCGVYVVACLYIILSMFGDVPAAIGTIVSGAFSPEAGFGGFIGVLVQGFRRAAFSNEAGVGSAAIAHSAAKTDHPVREGIVALLEPLIDTIIVCSMTGIVIVLTGAYDGAANPEFAPYLDNANGAGLTSQAFGSVVSWFPAVLSVAVILFAFSTMISWSYYGERCWAFLFGDKSSMVYRVLFLVMTFMGSVLTSTNILDMSDLMILGMAFPNILGLYILSGDVKKDLDEYWSKHKAGEFKEHRN